MNDEMNKICDDDKDVKRNDVYPHIKKRKLNKSQTLDFSQFSGEERKRIDEPATPSSSSSPSQDPFLLEKQDDDKQILGDAASSTPDSPSHRLLQSISQHTHLNTHSIFNQPYHYLNHAGLPSVNQPTSVSSTSQHLPKFPHVHQGPQPITPPPPAPQISAAELSLLTEVSATKNGTFQCTLCQKQFGYKNGLIRHVRLTHVGEKPYQCNICNRRFGYKHILMEHQNLHFGNRPYACVQCDKRFAARSNLIQHRTVHKRPYNCSMCNKRFDREDQLKKHLFAHPQSLLACSVCDYTATNQSDVNRHLAEVHKPIMAGESPFNQHYNNDHEREDNLVQNSHNRRRGSGFSNLVSLNENDGNMKKAYIDHDIMGVKNSSLQDQNVFGASHMTQSDGMDFQNIVIKKEVIDATEGVNQSESNVQSQFNCYDQHANIQHNSFPKYGNEWVDLKHAFQKSIMNSVENRSGYDREIFGSWNSQNSLAQQSHLQHSHQEQPPVSSQNQRSSMFNDDKPAQSLPPTLPGIHEVFSKKSQTALPSFAHFMPTSKSSTRSTQHHQQSQQYLPPQSHQQELLSLKHPPISENPITSSVSTGVQPAVTSLSSTSSSNFQRPTAQLPPIAHSGFRQTKDQAVQHSVTISGFPSLDDVLSYYIGQGRLFKCQHCSILFFERGMFFLHNSLHSSSNPWQCSICHKVCSDKNEFTLHFVNQQHNS